MPEAAQRDRNARAHERCRDSEKLTAGCVRDSARSHRFRRGLIAVGVAVALPAAFATSPAAASVGAGCLLNGVLSSDGAVVDMPGGPRECVEGKWVPLRPQLQQLQA